MSTLPNSRVADTDYGPKKIKPLSYHWLVTDGNAQYYPRVNPLIQPERKIFYTAKESRIIELEFTIERVCTKFLRNGRYSRNISSDNTSQTSCQ